MQFEPTVRRLVDAPFSCKEKVAAMESFPIAMDVQSSQQHTSNQFSGTTRVPQPPRKAPLLGVDSISPMAISTGPTAETYIPEAIRHLTTLTPEEHDEVMSGIAAQLLSAFQKKLSHQSEVIASLPTQDLLRIVLQHTHAQHPDINTTHNINATTHNHTNNSNTTNITTGNTVGGYGNGNNVDNQGHINHGHVSGNNGVNSTERRDTLKFVSPRAPPGTHSLNSPADIEAVVEGLTITDALAQDLHQSFTQRVVAGRRTSLRAPRRGQVGGGAPIGGGTSSMPGGIRELYTGNKGPPQTTQPSTVGVSSPIGALSPAATASPLQQGAPSFIQQMIASSVSPRHATPSTPIVKAPVPTPRQAPLEAIVPSADPSMSGDLLGVRSDDNGRGGIAPNDIGSTEDAIHRRGLVYTIANIDTKLTKTRAQLQVEEEETALSQKVPKVAPMVEYALDAGALEGLPPIQPRANGTIPVMSTRPEVLDLQIRREYVMSMNETAISASNEQLNSVRTVLGDLKRVAAAEAQWQAEVNSREEQLSALEGQQAELRQILLSIQSALVATKAGKEIPEAVTKSLAKFRPNPNTNPLQRFNTFVPHDSPTKKRSMLNVPGRGGAKAGPKVGGSFARANRSVSQWGGAAAKGASSPDPKRPESPEGEAGGGKDRRRELDPETRLLVALHGGGQQVDSCTYKLSSNVTRLITLGKQVATHVQSSRQRSSTPAKDARNTSGRASDSLSLSQSRVRSRHESVVSMAAESEFGGMLDHLDAYSAVGEAMQKPLSEMTEEDLLKLALIKECEGELRALVGQRDRMRSQLEAGEEELVRIQGHLTTLTGPREGETRELAVELAHLLDRNRDSDADSSDFDDSDEDERPQTEGLVETEESGPTDSMLGLEHEPHNAAVQCDLGTGDPSGTDIGGTNKESVARFERLFRSERDLLNALRQLAVSVSHVLTFHWSMEAELTCKCCLQVFRRPSTVWPCGHVVCQECLFREVEEGEGLTRCGECESYSEAGSSLNDVLDGLCRVHHTLPFVPGEEQPHESSTYAALVDAMSMADVSTSGLTRAASQLYRRASNMGGAPAHTTRDHLATLHELVRNAKERVDTMNEAALLSPAPSVRRKATQVKILSM